METKLVRIAAKAHEIIRLEAIRQSFKKNCVVSMGDVIAQFAKKLNKKRRR